MLDAIDFMSVHIYPLSETININPTWDWQQLNVSEANRATAMMDAALAATVDHYAKVRAFADARGFAKMPIVIGEAGWKADATHNEFNRAHPVNQKMYFAGLQDWVTKVRAKTATGPVSIFYFQAFDEEWKRSDDGWGLFTKDRKARCAIQSRYAQGTGFTYDTSVSCTSAALFAPTPSKLNTSGTRFTVYADNVPTGATPAVATGLDWFGMDPSSTADVGESEDAYGHIPVIGAPGDTAHGIIVKPKINSNNWGWGALVAPSAGAGLMDLSAYEATGNLNFSIKTNYQGKLMFGFIMSSDDSTKGISGTTYTAFMPISPGQYNYQNNGQWVDVSIPISEIKKHGAKAYAERYSPTSVYDIGHVTTPFVILDDWGLSRNTPVRTNIPSIYLDNIYWSK